MKKTNPLISVCIPTYNRSSLLKEAVESVLAQEYPQFELIILNDCSTDDTREVVGRFADSRIKYRENRKNLGYVASMGKCTQLARGDWLLHLSDDDLLLPDALKVLVRVIAETRKRNIGFVVPQTININFRGETIFVPQPQLAGKDYIVFEPKEFIPNYTLYGRKIRGKYRFNTSFPSTLFRRDIFISEGMSSPALPVAHDLLIAAKICLKYPVAVVDRPLLKYRLHENWGSSLNRRGEFLEEYLRYLQMLFTFVEKENINFDYDFQSYCYHSLINYLFSIDGGLVRLAARYEGPFGARVKKILSYLSFAAEKEKKVFLYPQLYLVLFISLLPSKIIIKIGKMLGKI